MRRFVFGFAIAVAMSVAVNASAMNVLPDPVCTGNIFTDSGANSSCAFMEMVKQLGITSGCQADDPSTLQNEARYCPGDSVTREQMAIFLVRAVDTALMLLASDDPHLILNADGLASSTLDAAYSYSVSMKAIGGSSPYTYSCSADIPGVTVGIDPAAANKCILSGTPTALPVDAYTVTLAVSDNNGKTAQRQLRLTVKDPNALGLGLSPSSLPVAVVGSSYSQYVTIQGSGGSGNYLYDCAITAGGLSAWKSGNVCTISGTPTAQGKYPVTFSLYDTNNMSNTISQSVDLTVNAAPPTPLALSINPTSLSSGVANTAYNQSVTMTASGGVPPYTYGCSGSGISGVSAAVSGATCNIAGTPVASGTYTAFFTVTDSSQASQQKQAAFSVSDSGNPYNPIDVGLDFASVYPNVKTDTIPANGVKYYYFTLNRDVVNLQFYVVNTDWATDQDFIMSRTSQPTPSVYSSVRNSGTNSVSPSATYWYNFNTSQLEKLTVASINAKQGDKFYVTVFNASNSTGHYQIYWAVAN